MLPRWTMLVTYSSDIILNKYISMVAVACMVLYGYDAFNYNSVQASKIGITGLMSQWRCVDPHVLCIVRRVR